MLWFSFNFIDRDTSFVRFNADLINEIISEDDIHFSGVSRNDVNTDLEFFIVDSRFAIEMVSRHTIFREKRLSANLER